MAVAVKTSPGAKKDAPPADPAVLSLVGVVYLVACLALLFQVIPSLFWPAWQAIGLGKYTFQGGAVLLLVVLAAGAVCLWVGGKLLGTNAPPGVRAGIFTALVGLLVVALLARWASVWIEHWAFNGLFSPSTGAIVTSVIAVGLLVLFLRMFFGKGMHESLVYFEEAGWFHATSYKSNQGQIVRRATIFALLIVAAAGIYTLLNHNTLRRYGPDLALNIPFTGTVNLESYADGADLIADGIPDSAKGTVEIRFAGASPVAVGRVLTVESYKGAVDTVVKDADNDFRVKYGPDLTKAWDKDGSTYVREVNHIVYEQFRAWLALPIAERLISEDTTRRLRGIDAETDEADLSRLIASFKREVSLAGTRRIRVTEAGDSALLKPQVGKIVLRDTFNSEATRLKAAGKTPPEGDPVGKLGAAFDLPLAVLRVDRFALQGVDKKLDPAMLVYVVDAGESDQLKKDEMKLQAGTMVTKEHFEEVTEALKDSKLAYKLPVSRELRQPDGPTRYQQLTLIPSIALTVPLLLMALALWISWRIVNVPSFADFLIATEAEMAKVSWTTQKRLWQDTIVVLVTVLVMAVFLFVADWGWKTILQTIRVLHIPKEDAAKQLKVEDKRY